MIRSLTMPNSAGSRVSAISTAISTVPAAAMPIWVRKLIRTTDSPRTVLLPHRR